MMAKPKGTLSKKNKQKLLDYFAKQKANDDTKSGSKESK